jgi:hypothetical protein
VTGAGARAALSSTGTRSSSGTDEHAASTPRMAAGHARRAALRNRNDIAMWVILLEALGALALLILIVWWTMFSGRKGGERRGPEDR